MLFDTKLNLMIKLLQLPSDTLSVRRARRACPALSSLIENSHTSGVIHPRSLFSEAKTTQKGPWAKPTQTSHRHWPRRKSSRSRRSRARLFPVRVLWRAAARRKWNSQVKSIALWHYSPANSHVYQLLKHTLLVKGGSGCKPLREKV